MRAGGAFGGRKREGQHTQDAQNAAQTEGGAGDGGLTRGDVGGRVRVGQARHLASDADLAGPASAAKVREPGGGGGGRWGVAVQENVGVKRFRCGDMREKLFWLR